jgi:predicted PurR-regulated permease PerM
VTERSDPAPSKRGADAPSEGARRRVRAGEASRIGNDLIVRSVAALLCGVALLWVLYEIRGALLVIYISGLLALGFSPIVQVMERQRIVGTSRLPRWAALLVLYFGILSVAAALFAVVLPPLFRQSAQLWSDLPAYIAQAQRALVEHRILDREMSIDEILKMLPSPSAALPALFGALQSVIGAMGTVIAILVLPYYLLVESESLHGGLLKLFPVERRPWVARITYDVTHKVGAWLNGQLLLSAIIGVTASAGLWLLGVPYFYVLGLIAALGEFVPIIGPIVSAVPAVLLGLTVSVHTGLFAAVYFGVQQFIEGNILVPRVMQRQVGVSAWTVIVALLIGSELLGIVGAILAVPSAAIVQVFLQEYLNRDATE